MNAENETFPLTAFEHMMWADDRPDTPMVFYLRLLLSGEFHPERFQRAICSALKRHPLLQCLACGKPHWSRRNLYWQPVSHQVDPFIQWERGGELFHSPNERVGINISEEIGVRFFIQANQGKTKLLVQFHHAVTDAQGGSQFLEDVLIFYHAETKSIDPQNFLPVKKNVLLKTRGEFHLSSADYHRRRWIDRRKICSYLLFLPEIICKIKKNVTPHQLPREIGTSTQFVISNSRFDHLVNYSKSKRVTINDLLLRDFFLTLKQWTNRKSKLERKKNLRIFMPVDMRTSKDQKMPAANVVSMYSLDRKSTEINSSDHFLNSISQETILLKKNYMGMAMIRSLRIISTLRWGFLLTMKPSFIYPCHATVILSNLGIPLKKTLLPKNEQREVIVGNLTVESWELLPPFRPNSPLSIGIGTEGKTLQVTLHYNSQVMSKQDAQELCDIYEAYLGERLKNDPKPAI